MKRYSTTSIRAYAPAEDPNGDWVRYEDAVKRIASLEAALHAIVAVRDMPASVENIARKELEAGNDQS